MGTLRDMFFETLEWLDARGYQIQHIGVDLSPQDEASFTIDTEGFGVSPDREAEE